MVRWPLLAQAALLGLLTGMLSWLLPWGITGFFEPFDTGAGLRINQLVLVLGCLCLFLVPGLAALTTVVIRRLMRRRPI